MQIKIMYMKSSVLCRWYFSSFCASCTTTTTTTISHHHCCYGHHRHGHHLTMDTTIAMDTTSPSASRSTPNPPPHPHGHRHQETSPNPCAAEPSWNPGLPDPQAQSLFPHPPPTHTFLTTTWHWTPLSLQASSECVI